MDKSLSADKHNLKEIRGIVFDVDGVLSPSTIPLDAVTGMPVRMCNIKDGFALQLAVKMGLKIAIITGADCEAIRARFGSLGITDIFTRAGQKLPVLQQWAADNKLSAKEIIFVGDDIPDYESMLYAGISVAPADAAAEIIEVADVVVGMNGGHGVARIVVENVLKAQGKWMSTAKAFGW